MTWTKVTDALPPDGEAVMVTVHYHDWGKQPEKEGIVLPFVKWDAATKSWLGVCVRDNADTWEPLWYKWFVSHWMPMPQPAED